MDEMANIQKVALQAFKTFRTIGATPKKQNIELLKSMMGSITAADVNINDPSKDRRRSIPGAPPVTHVNILECPYFSVAVFIVNRGERLPLHDHAGMHGLCKVLYGTIQVEMYDRYSSKETDKANDLQKNEPQKFVYHGEQLFTSKSNPCMVTPMYGNYHSIKAVGGSAAFLDILAPPYSSDQGRDCLYYKECLSRKISLRSEEQSLKYLVEVPCPEDFFCDSKPYNGPSVILDALIKECDKL